MTKNDFEKDKYQEEYQNFLSNDLWDFVSNVLLKTKNFSKNHSYFLAGNGASAAIASHVATDINKALGCIARTFHDPALMTCFANDYGFENWLAKAIEHFSNENDIVILISSSGRSLNILRAAEATKYVKGKLITLTGPGPDPSILELSDCHLSVNSLSYNIIECCHMMALCAAVDSRNMINLTKF